MPGAGPAMGPGARGVGFSQGGIAVSPANASSQFRFVDLTISGTLFPTVQSAPTSAVFSDQFIWLTGVGQSSDYWVRSTETSGTFTADPSSGAWIQLNATRTWSKVRSSDVPGTDSVTATIEIASDSAGVNILASFTVTLSATVVS